jgi:8-amino-7-oxononanoate synthase
VDENRFDNTLADLEARGLLRTLATRAGVGGKYVRDGETVLNFSSNDYLDLGTDPRVGRVASEAIEQWGTGSGASRLMSGHLALHEQLETRLATWLGTEASLVFGSGFLTNLGVITALVGRGDVIFTDRLNHASLVDGARLSGATVQRYPHADAEHLATLLEKHATSGGNHLIATDSVFSMDGDMAPLEQIGSLAREHGCLWMVDEAHAVGVFGASGAGVCEMLPADHRPDVIVGTMSKSMGGYGGFVACSEAIRRVLINRARSFIYSTALPPACLGAGLGALEVIGSDAGAMGVELLSRASTLRGLLASRGLEVGPSQSQIVPVMVGDNDRAVALSQELATRNILAVAVRPPTVPVGTARLRLSVTLAHSTDDLKHVADTISAVVR